MTTTALISAQTIGTSTNIGNRLFGTKTAAQATTTAFLISGKVTRTGEGGPAAGSANVRVWYTSSSFSLADAGATNVSGLERTARYVDVPVSFDGKPANFNIRDSSLEPLTGASIYVWVEVPKLTVAATLDVNLVELP